MTEDFVTRELRRAEWRARQREANLVKRGKVGGVFLPGPKGPPKPAQVQADAPAPQLWEPPWMQTRAEEPAKAPPLEEELQFLPGPDEREIGGDPAAEEMVDGRPRRRRQPLGAAAVLLLAAGLGADGGGEL